MYCQCSIRQWIFHSTAITAGSTVSRTWAKCSTLHAVLPWQTCIAPCNPLYIRSVSIQHKKPKLQEGLFTAVPTLHCLVSSPSWKGKVIEEWESKLGYRCWLGNRPASYALLPLPGSVVCSQYLVTSLQISVRGHHWLSSGHLYIRKAVLQTSPIQTELHR